MLYILIFGLISIALSLLFYAFIDARTDWMPYGTWLVTINLVTFVMYGLDKTLANLFGKLYPDNKSKTIRTPELILNLLAIAGGFLGGLAGIRFFNHKKHPSKDPMIWSILALSALGHAVFIYDWLLGWS